LLWEVANKIDEYTRRHRNRDKEKGFKRSYGRYKKISWYYAFLIGDEPIKDHPKVKAESIKRKHTSDNSNSDEESHNSNKKHKKSKKHKKTQKTEI
jgi:hypothetical protein